MIFYPNFHQIGGVLRVKFIWKINVFTNFSKNQYTSNKVKKVSICVVEIKLFSLFSPFHQFSLI